MEGLRMSKYHLFAGRDYYPEGGTKDYKGVFETLEQAYGVAIDEDWAELAVINEAGALEHYAHRDSELKQYSEHQIQRSIGWSIEETLSVMERKLETWRP